MIRIDVVAGAIFSAGRCLAAQRTDCGSADALLWEFPGGKIEPGETPQQALVRELREELGVHVQIGPWLASSKLVRGETLICIELFAVESNEEPRCLEHAELRWVDAAQLAQMAWCEADRQLLDGALTQLRLLGG